MSLILLSVMALMLDIKLSSLVNKSLLKLLQSNLVKDRTKIDSLRLGARFLLKLQQDSGPLCDTAQMAEWYRASVS